ncbi:ABC transporter family protein [Trichomonas vaginalis G3]|uniref:ABC transporter family protein n=2 Tax=Trichomonas vaginalis (strain ATCC PRA-98 / G3) TaxID=412133 RepID=A2DNW8_TRIV3|nr:ABC transporter family protein [Trichomonas vaginalis G3]|eukprot:XP_001578949.1 ABC transporter family protein [Trichomonas vaginalis G3]
MKIFQFLPQGAIYLLIDNVAYCKEVKEVFDFATAPKVFHLISQSTVSKILLGMAFAFLFLFLFFNLMMPRTAGTLPVGFAHIFSFGHWKKVFAFRRAVKINHEDDKHFIEVNNIDKKYGFSTHALKDVSFNIDSGEIIILIGPNGCGKSTLLNSMTGSIDCNGGTLSIYGELCKGGFSELQQHLGICFQDNIFFDRLSVREHLNFFAAICGYKKDKIREVVDHAIDSFNLEECENNRAMALSGGQKRKLCIALALIGTPRIVILDEPTAGIDVSTRQTIWKAISGFGITAIVSTHSLEEAESVSSRLFVMRNGELVFDGPSNELRRKYHCGYRLTPMYLPDTDTKDMNEKLLSWCKSKISESTEDETHENSILIPVCPEIVSLLEELDTQKSGFNMSEFNIIIEQLENVLYRMYADDENAEAK